MLGSSIVKKLFGSRNERVIKQLQKEINKINELEKEIQSLSDEALKGKTAEFKERYQKGERLDSLLPEAFAVVREASIRTLGMRHFDVQLIGGMVLHQGKIAEMCTGEGKTLSATLPCYLNALTGKGVHVITVNDYLAQRDAKWMEPVYSFLGMSVGINLSNMPHDQKQEAYKADITYGTNNEYGFDYLRDNMAFSLSDKVQRDLHFAVVDEVDSILIDEARTPLIISGPAEDSADIYLKINKIIPALVKQEEEEGPGDFSLDEKTKQAHLTESGHEHVEALFVEAGILTENDSLYSPNNISLMHHLSACLRAHTLFHKDVDYIVRNDEVIIVDEHTGRTMEGRRWSDGLHQAMEAKEGVTIQNENQTLASITFQNYFRLYEKLSGMTGTADTEAYELQQIYNLEVVVIPTNRPIARKDMADQIYLTSKERYDAVIEDIIDCQKRKQPVLVGTASIEASEYLHMLLKKAKIPHQVLNAKFHQKEAGIIAEAGRPGGVTIATNMAGRGTDIVLGGNLQMEIEALPNKNEASIENLKQDWKQRHEQVIKAGGLHVIGSERHEARRIDNQLRGRSGRQGDPGSTRFYLSLEDNLMRIFASDRVAAIMQKLGMKEGEPIEHPWVNKAIENAQRKVEGHNFDIRKQLLEFDDVANEQRIKIYEQRAELMAADAVNETIEAIREDVINRAIDSCLPPESLEEQWDIPALEKVLESDFNLKLELQKWLEEDESIHEEHIRQRILSEVNQLNQQKIEQIGIEAMQQFEKNLMLQILDSHWKDHLAAMDHLRQGIHLRGYAQKNPKQEYKREAYELFSDMLDEFQYEVISMLCKVEIQEPSEIEAMEAQRRQANNFAMQFQHENANAMDDFEVGLKELPEEIQKELEHPGTFKREQPKTGRNEPCPCGSGKKYKHCHGKLN